MTKLKAICSMLFVVSTATFLASIATLVVPITAQAQTPTLAVNAAATRTTINPSIYGGQDAFNTNALDLALVTQAKMGNVRWGGDTATTYNWENDGANTGNDTVFFFAGNASLTSAPTPGATPDSMISKYRTAYSGIQPLITIPIIPYVNGYWQGTCSFPQASYVTQQSYATFTGTTYPSGGLSCGNGVAASNGQTIQDTNLAYNYVPNTTTIEGGWISHLISTFGSCSGGGVCWYQLDNEPGGWSNTHRDVEYSQPNYTTIASLGETYASLIRSKDSTAAILGPSDFGLWGWVDESPTSDPAIVYYLKQFAAYDATNGVRTLTDLDEHNGIGDNTQTIQYDFDQVRSYWDPTSTYYSQIYANYANDGWPSGISGTSAIQFIPRCQAYAAAYYPGTHCTMSEYEVSHWPAATGIPASGGSGYSLYDTGVLTGAGCTGLDYQVFGVSSGAVTSVHVYGNAAGCSVQNAVTTAKGGTQAGGGTGLTLNLTTVNPEQGGSNVIDAAILADALGVFGYYDLQLADLFDPISITSLGTISVDNCGSGYTVGNGGGLNNGASGTYQVTSVGAGGCVTGVMVNQQGGGNSLATGVATTWYGPGSPSGLTLNITSLGDAEAYTYMLYRNYDGAGHGFGDTSVTSSSTNSTELSVYGATRSSDGALTVMVVNKEATSYSTTLTLSGFAAATSAGTYTYSDANLGGIVAGTTSVSGGVVSYTFPPYSVTEFVFTSSGSSGPPAPTPPTGLVATAQ
jgi:glycosyl hydrolase family 44